MMNSEGRDTRTRFVMLRAGWERSISVDVSVFYIFLKERLQPEKSPQSDAPSVRALTNADLSKGAMPLRQ